MQEAEKDGHPIDLKRDSGDSDAGEDEAYESDVEDHC